MIENYGYETARVGNDCNSFQPVLFTKQQSFLCILLSSNRNVLDFSRLKAFCGLKPSWLFAFSPLIHNALDLELCV